MGGRHAGPSLSHAGDILSETRRSKMRYDPLTVVGGTNPSKLKLKTSRQSVLTVEGQPFLTVEGQPFLTVGSYMTVGRPHKLLAGDPRPLQQKNRLDETRLTVQYYKYLFLGGM